MNSNIYLEFLGAAGTVTGSRFLLKTPEMNILIDCGLFQGEKELRERNWEPFPFPPEDIDVLLLTHGHLDHVGYLPRLVADGFSGKVLGTAPTLAIARIILEDSAKIQEEDAEQANREGYSKHHPALPLYTRDKALQSFDQFEVQARDEWIELGEEISARFRYAGHILGATYIELNVFGKRIVFSGDLGRQQDVLLEPPVPLEEADVLIMESTYGDREHIEEDVEELLEQYVLETIRNRGNLIIPSFAVERTQQLMYYFWKLYTDGRIPDIPIVLDSPMGSRVLEVFTAYAHWHELDDVTLDRVIRNVDQVDSYRETWQVIDDTRSKVIIAGSGMVTGGRVLTYLQQLIDEASTRILLVGYQAEGTRGRDLQEGAKEITFFGKPYPVKATVWNLQSLSAHADRSELLLWLKDLRKKPEKVFLVHGEPQASKALKQTLEQEGYTEVIIPSQGEIFEV